MVKILDTTAYNPNFEQHILWQYDNAKHLKSLISSKKNWYKTNNEDFWKNLITDFLCIDTANDWGLNLWGKILQVKRLYNLNGQQISLSKKLYRRLIKGSLQLLYSKGSIPEIHKFCNSVFEDYVNVNSWAVYVKDLNNMTLQYIVNFEPTQEELALLYDRDFLPTPTGVKSIIYIMPASTLFGFYGTEFQTFDNGVFYNGQIF